MPARNEARALSRSTNGRTSTTELRYNSVVSTDLREAVTEWLNKQGFPLEMVVAAEFRRQGFLVIQSEFYEDPTTKAQREIDVAAHAQESTGKRLVRITFIVECKVSRDKPWVIFTSETVALAKRAGVAQRAASRTGRRFLDAICYQQSIQQLPFFRLPDRPGYAMVQALREGGARDLAYEALAGVSAATAAEASEPDISSFFGRTDIIKVVFPVVVVDGKLFESYLDETGKIHVAEVTEATLVWRNPAAASIHSIIRISTLPFLSQLVAEALSTATALLAEQKAAKDAVRAAKV